MKEQISVLIISNSDEDTKLIVKDLKKSCYDISWKKAETTEQILELLINQSWSIIFSDYIVSDFTALEVLKLKNEINFNTPFILIADHIGEANAIEIMKAGCNDYILRNNISGISSVLVREINNSKEKIQSISEINKIKKEHRILSSEAKRYKLAIEGSNDGIWDWDIESSQGYLSYKWKELVGVPECEINDFYDYWTSIIHPDDVSVFEETIWDYLNKKSPYFACEYRIRNADNEYIWILSRGKCIWTSDLTPVRMAGSNSNINDRKIAQEKVNYLAYYDKLTNLFNRSKFEECLGDSITYSKKNKNMFGIIYLDLDNFKTLNESLGHAFGDLLLIQVANILRLACNKKDLIARLGGDEFAILMPEIPSIDSLKSAAEKIKNLFSSPVYIHGNEIHTSVSIGIAIYPIDGQDEQTLLKNSDTAMYHAKEAGKNNCQFFVPDMNIRITEKLKLQNSLRNALKNGEFTVYYQPQVDIITRKVIGFEALVRWIHPTEGIIPPNKFIPTAEEMGLIVPLGEYVLQSACNQAKQWQEQGYTPVTIAVNLSAKQFQQTNLIESVQKILQEIDLNSKWLELEITESISMEDLDYTIDVLNKFKDLNIKIALDDFGTGYSSLNYLKKLPIDVLKIDKSFVNHITSDTKQASIARAITTLAHEMDLSIVAEGVETEDQLSFLRDLKCDIAQGYLFSKPVPSHDALKLIII